MDVDYFTSTILIPGETPLSDSLSLLKCGRIPYNAGNTAGYFQCGARALRYPS